MAFGVNNEVTIFQRKMNKLIQEETIKDTSFDNTTVAGKNQEHNYNVQKFSATITFKNFILNEEKTVSCAPSINILGFFGGQQNNQA